jgi:diacylglycerol kinase (ATP)
VSRVGHAGRAPPKVRPVTPSRQIAADAQAQMPDPREGGSMALSEYVPTKRKGVARLLYATLYSYHGLRHAVRCEAAFRQEVLLGLAAIPAAFVMPVDPGFKAVLMLSVFVVLITELLNTAIEAVVDHASPYFHPLAKRAKDLGSAAVFLSLVGCACAWAWAVYEAFLKA